MDQQVSCCIHVIDVGFSQALSVSRGDVVGEKNRLTFVSLPLDSCEGEKKPVIEPCGCQPPFHGAEVGELADVGLQDKAEVRRGEIPEADRRADRSLPDPW